MDLVCPHCQCRVSVGEEKAGQVTTCPQCSKHFMAPSLGPAPRPLPPLELSPLPNPPIVETFSATAPPPGPVLDVPAEPRLQPLPGEPREAPLLEPPSPPGEYTRSFALTLRAKWLAFVPTGCLLLIFFLSFFTWHYVNQNVRSNLWGLAFIDQGNPFLIQGHFLAYVILMFLGGPVTVVAMVFDRGWIELPKEVRWLLLWKDLAVGTLLGLAFGLLCYDYLHSHFVQNVNSMALALKLAFRLHFLALLASFLMFWLRWRKRSSLPLPKLECRW